MRCRTNILIAFLLAPVLWGHADAQSLSKVFEKVGHSIVVILTTDKNLVLPKEKGLVRTHGIGAGVLISNDGKVLTASHLVQVADAVTVEFWNGKIIPAHVVASAPIADVALLQLEKVPDNVTPAVLENSDEVQIGDEVFIVGTPYGVGRTLTFGHISARHKSKDAEARGLPAIEILQTDAAINKGDSGAPVFDMQGKVIGIVNSILSRSGGSEGIGFAIASNTAKRLLLENKSFWMGFSGYLLADDLARIFNLPQPAGLLIERVAQSSPAALLGLQPGDSMAFIDGKKLLVGGDILLEIIGVTVAKDTSNLNRIQVLLNNLQSGDTLHAKVFRAGRIVELSLVIWHKNSKTSKD